MLTHARTHTHTQRGRDTRAHMKGVCIFIWLAPLTHRRACFVFCFPAINEQHLASLAFVEHTHSQLDVIFFSYSRAFSLSPLGLLCAGRSGASAAACCVIHAGLPQPECGLQHNPPTDRPADRPTGGLEPALHGTMTACQHRTLSTYSRKTHSLCCDWV